MGFLIDLVIYLFLLPGFMLFVFTSIVKEVSEYYGLWLPPAVFGLTIGVDLLIIGPSSPDAEFESILQSLAGSHVMGICTPFVLIGVAGFCLLARPVYDVITGEA